LSNIKQITFDKSEGERLRTSNRYGGALLKIYVFMFNAKIVRVDGKLTKSNDAETLHPMPRKIIVTKRLEKNQGQE